MKSTTIIVFAAILALCLVAEGKPMPKALYRPGRPMGYGIRYKDGRYRQPNNEIKEDAYDVDERFAIRERDAKRYCVFELHFENET